MFLMQDYQTNFIFEDKDRLPKLVRQSEIFYFPEQSFMVRSFLNSIDPQK